MLYCYWDMTHDRCNSYFPFWTIFCPFTPLQDSKFASAVSKCWGFCWGISKFYSICLSKKNAKAIKCLEILKKYVAKNKIYFCFKKKRNVPLNNKVIFVFHTIFKTWFHYVDHLLYYPQTFVFSFYTSVVLLYQFLRN